MAPFASYKYLVTDSVTMALPAYSPVYLLPLPTIDPIRSFPSIGLPFRLSWGTRISSRPAFLSSSSRSIFSTWSFKSEGRLSAPSPFSSLF